MKRLPNARLRFQAVKIPSWRDRIDLFVMCKQRFNEGPPVMSILTDLTFRAISPDEQATEPEPALSLLEDEGQALMDALWDAGIRPSEGTGSAGALAAVQYHLEDMRRLVFEVQGPHNEIKLENDV